MIRPRHSQAATFGRGLFYALIASTLALTLTGCGSLPLIGKKPAPAPAPPQPGDFTASPHVMIGRVLAVDLPRSQAIVDLIPAFSAEWPSTFAGAELASRTDTLQPTARLIGTELRRGRTLGVRIASGRPQVGDEVVWRRRP